METILSGMQPTGQLHLGNYEGALKNWAALQNQYEMFTCIVDWHALTSEFSDTTNMKDNILQMAADFLAGGLRPDKIDQVTNHFINADWLKVKNKSAGIKLR